MFIKTVKIKSFWAAVTVLSVVGVAVAAILFASQGARERAAMYRMTSEHQRQEFISELGWETDEEYDTCRIVIIPQEFDEVYTSYNDLQKQQGFDLEEYKGKTVEIYSYPVHNYPGESDVMLSLMVYNGQLIGGDVCSTAIDGFMQGLRRIEEKESADDSSATDDSSAPADSSSATDDSSEADDSSKTDSVADTSEETA